MTAYMTLFTCTMHAVTCPDVPPGYRFEKGMDVVAAHHILQSTRIRDVARLARQCSALPHCTSFNTDGWLSSGSTAPLTNWAEGGECDGVYIRLQASHPLPPRAPAPLTPPPALPSPMMPAGTYPPVFPSPSYPPSPAAPSPPHQPAPNIPGA